VKTNTIKLHADGNITCKTHAGEKLSRRAMKRKGDKEEKKEQTKEEKTDNER
jgi:hypothetical protein